MRRYAIALVLSGLLVGSDAAADRSSAADGATRLAAAQLLLDPGDVPPPDGDPRWQPVPLPDRWREQRPGAGGFAWYRFELALDAAGDVQATDGPWAVYLPSVNMNAAAWVNGAFVGTGGRFEEPVAHNFNRPLLFVFPTRLLRAAGNVVHVRLFAYEHHYGGLGTIEVGPEALLRGEYEWRHLLQIGLSQLATVIALLTGALMALLWLGTRDPVYGTFALATGFWAVTSLNYWVRDVPVGHWTWERIVNASLDGFAVALAIWAHRFVALRRPRLEYALIAWAAAAALLALLLPPRAFYAVVNPLHLCSLGIGVYASVLAMTARQRFARWERALYVVAGVSGLGFAGHDLARQFGLLDAGGPYLIALIAPLMILGFGSSLLARFVASLEQTRQQNVELERRVREKTQELERNHERLRNLERDRAVSGERERIMQEMHDGLGGQLVAALAMSQSARARPSDVTEALRGALADMRSVIDSLDPKVSDLGALLGIFRSRVDPLLRARDVKLLWRVGELPADTSLGAEGFLNVLRILQEAVHNAVTHGAAREIALATRCEADAIVISVSDDGPGFDVGAVAAGRGLGNMRRRASAVGAEVDVARVEPHGTRVELRLPLSRGS